MPCVVSTAKMFLALSNPRRLKILNWLTDPEACFPPQREADLIADGVCVGHLTAMIGLMQPTVTRHLQILLNAGLVSSKQVRNWIFYRLVRDRFDHLSLYLKRFQQSGTRAG